MRKDHRAAHILIGLARIHAEADGELERLVELSSRELGRQGHRLVERIARLAVDLAGRALHSLSGLCHGSYSTTSRPTLRAVPSMVRIAASTDSADRSGRLSTAISRTWARVTLPTLPRFGSAAPFSTPAAFFSNTEAGGVLVMKVKDRSAYTVMITGMIIPGCACVLALNC